MGKMQLAFFVHNQHPAQGQRENLDGEDIPRMTAPQHVWTVVNLEEQKNCACYAMLCTSVEQRINNTKIKRTTPRPRRAGSLARSLTRTQADKHPTPENGSSRGPYWPRSGCVICGPSSRSTRM